MVGHSGAGKSTLIDIILRFIEESEGRILIDGQNLASYDIRTIRRQIGYVQQEALLFEGSIRSNIQMAKRNATEEEIWDACEKACIADFIQGLPDRLDTLIGNDGIQLSGGQKQRVAIARILLKDPKILIFDEATSALDYETEHAIQKQWNEIRTGRTTIVIAHRLASILDSDRVALLHDGCIIAVAHHQKLLENNEVYRKLFLEQYAQGETHAI